MEQEKTTALKIIIGVDWESFNWALLLTFIIVMCFMLHRVRRFIKLKDKGVKARKMTMVRVDIPFTVSLELSKNVLAIVCSSVKCKIELYWCVNISEFHKEVEADWTDDIVLKNSCHGAKMSTVLEKGVKQFILDLRMHFNSSVPRTDYPVAIIVRNVNNFLSPRESQALITTIHLGEYATSARIITQSLKLASGQVTLLQRLFPSGLYKEGTNDLCAVCVEKPVTRVILPCKHACLCKSCFERVITCPMCRAGIQSFFCISSELEGKDENLFKKFQTFVKSVRLRL